MTIVVSRTGILVYDPSTPDAIISGLYLYRNFRGPHVDTNDDIAGLQVQQTVMNRDSTLT